MKTKLIKLSSLIVLILLFASTAKSQEKKINGVLYELHQYNGGIAIIDRYQNIKELPDTLVIPQYIEVDDVKYKVESQYMSCFRGAPIKVLIWECDSPVREIMFASCPNLSVVELKGNVNEIEQKAFYGCGNLKKLVLNEGLEFIGDGAFYAAYSLEELTLPQSLNSIRPTSFDDCTSLKKVIFKNKNLEQDFNKYPKMFFKNSPFAKNASQQTTSGKRKPNQAVTNDSRFKVKKSGTVVY